LLELRSDVGLLAEEYDPGTGRQLGNMPQAFSHVGLVTSARHIDRALEGGCRSSLRKS
jgi:GH15 family glucan-1,4-alpha-glucosidase